MPLQAPPDALHLTILSNAIAPWLGGASAAKRGALAANPPAVADWYSTITDLQHEKLKRLNGEAWTTQNRVDQAFSAIKSPEDFGAELLQKALKDEFDLDANVRTTYLQLYIPLTLAGITVKPGAARTWSVSLLDAALHNFEAAEATMAPMSATPASPPRPAPPASSSACPASTRRSAWCNSPPCAGAWTSAASTSATWTRPWIWTTRWPAPPCSTGSNKATSLR